jgi:hypothetical protein
MLKDQSQPPPLLIGNIDWSKLRVVSYILVFLLGIITVGWQALYVKAE